MGGVNLMLQPEVTIAFSKASMLSPDGRCKSFDSRANGYVRGEGAGVIILKPLARAMADGDRIYAVIRATAVNQDGRTAGISVPSQASQESNIKDALRLADISPASIQYVEAHGTGTPVGDPIEAAALGAIYGKARNGNERCVLGSIKSNMGHLEAGAGIAGLIKTALCLHHRQIPTNLHFENPNPQIPFDELRLRVAQRLEPWPETNGQPPRAGVNSFGFGGTNGHAILEAAPETKPVVRTAAEPADGRAWLLPISARSEPALSDLARSYLDSLAHERGLKSEPLRDICYSASVKRSHHDFRMALVAHDRAELAEQLEAAVRGEERANCSTGRTSSMPLAADLRLLGHGPAVVGDGARVALARARLSPRGRGGERAVPSARRLVAAGEADRRRDRIRKFRRLASGSRRFLRCRSGLRRYGDRGASSPPRCWATAQARWRRRTSPASLSLEDAVRVTFHRSRLQFRTAGQGGMLAAGISREEAARPGRTASARHLDRGDQWASLGHPVRRRRGARRDRQDAQRSGRLQPRVAGGRALSQPEDGAAREGVARMPARDPAAAGIDAVLLDRDRHRNWRVRELDARYWYRNVREPVLFHDTMQRLIDAGHRVFLEIGAHPVLRRDIAACLSEKSLQGATLGSLRRADRERAALLGSLGRLYSLGAEIDWRKLYPADATAIKLPAYPFQAESHWRESDQNRRLRVGTTGASIARHPARGRHTVLERRPWLGGT